MSFLRKLAKNMGWEIASAPKKKSGIELSMLSNLIGLNQLTRISALQNSTFSIIRNP